MKLLIPEEEYGISSGARLLMWKFFWGRSKSISFEWFIVFLFSVVISDQHCYILGKDDGWLASGGRNEQENQVLAQ